MTLYNARIDNLRSKTWSELFMVHHGVLVAHKFYEWVQVKDLLEKAENGVSLAEVEAELLRRQDTRKERVMASGKPFKLSQTEKLPILDRKITVAFSPVSCEQDLLLPVIFAERKQPDGSLFKSFAVVTTDPPPIVRSTGHDRCPIAFNTETAMNIYLEPWKTNAGAIEELLHTQKPPTLQFTVDKDL